MIAAVDVHYDEAARRGRAAAVVFDAWEDGEAAGEYVAEVENVADYVPGEFYRRELPCLMAVMGKVEPKPDVVVVGVAKTFFVGAPAREVLRGGSKMPLYVSAAGMEVEDAADSVARMHGGYRIPTMLKRVDRVARGGGTSSVRP